MARADHSPISKKKMEKTIRWISETLLSHPEKKREKVIQEAEVRFDLSPAECAFLTKNFSTPQCGS
jgi:hypothetical protein